MLIIIRNFVTMVRKVRSTPSWVHRNPRPKNKAAALSTQRIFPQEMLLDHHSVSSALSSPVPRKAGPPGSQYSSLSMKHSSGKKGIIIEQTMLLGHIHFFSHNDGCTFEWVKMKMWMQLRKSELKQVTLKATNTHTEKTSSQQYSWSRSDLTQQLA